VKGIIKYADSSTCCEGVEEWKLYSELPGCIGMHGFIRVVELVLIKVKVIDLHLLGVY
jgi:hypothetical protein